MVTRSAGRVTSSIALAFVITSAACTADGSSDSPAPSRGPVGGTLRLGMASVSYWGMDPRDEWNPATWELFRCCLLRTMTSYDVSGDTPDLRPIPDLAAAPPEISADGRTWTFRLREGVTYAPPLDDVEVTSGDFVRSIARAGASFDPEGGGGSLPSYMYMIDGFEEYVNGDASTIVGLQTPDPHTLRVVTTRLDSTLLYLFAMPITAPIPPLPGSDAPFGVADGYDMTPRPDGGADGYGRFLVASGPYMFEGAEDVDYALPVDQRTPASGFTPWKTHIISDTEIDTVRFGSMTLVRNPSWRPEDDPLRAALPDRIELVGNHQERLFPQMRSGKLDLVFDAQPPRSMLKDYQDDPALQPLIQAPAGSRGLVFASFNVARPPFDDVAVRKAVAYAMDRIHLARLFGGPQTFVAQHFGPDTFEASLLASWGEIPGEGGHGDRAAALREMAGSRYAQGERCADPACGDVQIVLRDVMEPGLADLEEALAELGIRADIKLVPGPYDCLSTASPVDVCIGMGWIPDFPSAAQFLGAFFSSDGALPMTRLGATPGELRRSGYDVTHVPSLDERIDRCERELGAGQAPCWARLDQYVVTQLMPAVPMGFFGTVMVSSPAIGQLPWDQVLQVPALERIEAPPQGVGATPSPSADQDQG